MANFIQATQGISNFITAPDYIPTVLIRNPSEEQIALCMEACNAGGNIYNVYIQTPENQGEWLDKVERIADFIIDAQNDDLVGFFNK